jgi:hypothetical protein
MITANVSVRVTLTGDLGFDGSFAITQNINSPGTTEVLDLTTGNNTITIPSPGTSACIGVLVIPPSGSTVVLTLKGVNGDTGFVIHPKNPSYIGVGSEVSSIVINASGAVTCRFIFV